MKKIFYVLFSFCSLLFFTGCNSSVLNCTKEVSHNGEMDIIHNVKLYFKGDEVSKFSAITNIVLSEDYTEHKETLIEDSVSQFNGNEAVKYSVSENDNGFVFELSSNINKLSSDEKEKITVVNINQSYENTRLEYENKGYICE